MIRVAICVAMSLMLALLPAEIRSAPTGSMPKMRTVNLGFQQQAKLDGLVVKFVGYRDDRCPVDGKCVSAGSAEVLLWVEAPWDRARLVTLRWPGEGNGPILRNIERFGHYELWLHSLEPRPRTRGGPKPGTHWTIVRIRGFK